MLPLKERRKHYAGTGHGCSLIFPIVIVTIQEGNSSSFLFVHVTVHCSTSFSQLCAYVGSLELLRLTVSVFLRLRTLESEYLPRIHHRLICCVCVCWYTLYLSMGVCIDLDVVL